MKDKLRELAEWWKSAGCRNGSSHECADELLAILDAEGDGGAVGDALAHFTDYFVRNYPGPNTIIYDPKWHAPKIFRAAKYAIEQAHPARSGVVSDEDVEECVVVMKAANAAQWNATKDVTWNHGMRAALEHFAAIAQEKQHG